MDLFRNSTDWGNKLEPILIKYKDRKHPLEYQNLYQLLVMVVLSAQDSDANINQIAPTLFKAYPNIESLAIANKDDFLPYISKVRNFETKANWLLEIAKTIKKRQQYSTFHGGFNCLKRHRTKICQCDYAGGQSSYSRYYR